MENTTTPNTPNLAISDLMHLKEIVEVAAARGAFRAPELTAVGTTYDKLSGWLAATAPPAPSATPDAPSDSNAESEVTQEPKGEE